MQYFLFQRVFVFMLCFLLGMYGGLSLYKYKRDKFGKRNQRKWERHVVPDGFMDGNLTVLNITKTIQLSKVRFVQNQRFYSLKTQHYILMVALVTMLISVFQYGHSGARPGGQSKNPNKNKKTNIVMTSRVASLLPSLSVVLKHMIWTDVIWYDSSFLLTTL